MEGRYVNSPAPERRNRPEERENHHSCHNIFRGSKFYMLVGVSFGLLCIIQLALNVSFRQQAVCSNRSDNVSTGNFTLMSADDVRLLILERNQLVKERDQLFGENKILLREKTQIIQDNKQLTQENNQLVQQKNQLAQEKEQLAQENKQLAQDKDQLAQDKAKLAQEKDQLAQENNQLAQDKAKLTQENNQLIEVNKMLNQKIKELEMNQNARRCPPGWVTYMSCYQLSNMKDTWENAKQDCERKQSHLITLNDITKERIVHALGASDKMWIGLHCHMSYYAGSWLWTWSFVDGSPLHFINWNNWTPACGSGPFCDKKYVYVAHNSLSLSWNLGTSHEQYRWMCEMKQVW